MRGKSHELARPIRNIRIEDEAAQTMAEYAVVLGVITVAIVTTIGALSGGIQGLIQQVANLL